MDAAAYAPLLRRVAMDAEATVVLARPPFRAVITTQRFRELKARHPNVHTWAVGGHSHGGGPFGAMTVVSQTTAADDGVRGLAMLGAVGGGDNTVDLSDRRDLETLVVLATEDEIASPKKGARQLHGGTLVSDGYKKLPPKHVRRVIRGGNHAGFGQYGKQAGDGERTISIDEQHDQAARHLAAFLGRVQKRGGRK